MGIEEKLTPTYFGAWLKSRRKALDLTQSELAQRACCSLPALRKIEGGERRPSRQLAELLARSLKIPAEEQSTFIRVARGDLAVERLGSPVRDFSTDFHFANDLGPSTGNLPGMPTPFIGREPELTALGQLLNDSQCRLLTLVGPGGIGKTRLAIEAANRFKDLFPDGAWFVSLAPLTSPMLLIPAIADAVNFRFQGSSQPQGQLCNYLSEKRALLLLDNTEHLLDGFGVIAEILQKAQWIKLLVTSRERLNLLSEWVFEIQGLPVPFDDQAERFETYSSVALFMASARRIRAGFELREEDRPWVLRICRTMEGMPLGIELAAAWVGLLSCEEIAREIERNFDFLAASMRDLPERHRSLRASLDYSWKLLKPEERLILSRLSVFEGNFRREAAQEVCGASLDVLSGLKDKTLLNRTDQGYYVLHQLIRQYAARKLAEDPQEEQRVQDQHALYYAQRLSQWEKGLKSSQQVEILNEMAQKIGNLRQAWQWMVSHFSADILIRDHFHSSLFHNSLFSLSLFYEMRYRNWEAISLFTETVDTLKAVRDRFDETEDQGDFDSILGHITAYLGLHHSYILHNKQACEYLDEALRLLGKNPSRVEKAQAQIILAAVYSKQGQLRKSAGLLEQSRSIFQKEGDSWWYHLSLLHLAGSYMMLGKIQEGQLLYQEGLQLVEPGDLRLRLPIQNGIAYTHYLQNDYDGAERLLQENLPLSFQLGFDRQKALVHLYSGQVALATHRLELAEQYIQKSIDLLSPYGESHDLALGLIFSGKCLIARMEIEAAQDKFRQVIKIGQALEMVYLVYWGLVNLARTYMMEGQTEKAFGMALALERYPIEYKEAQEDGIHLLAELQGMVPKQPFEPASIQLAGKDVENLLGLSTI